MERLHWTERKAWADRFDGDVRSILRDVFGAEPVPADREADAKENTDYVVGGLRISVRIRRDKYRQYEDEVTFRWNVPSGNTPEIDKALSGMGDYMLYAFADAAESRIAKWTILDLSVLREWGFTPTCWKRNHDGSSDFVIVKIADLPPSFVYAASGEAKTTVQTHQPVPTKNVFRSELEMNKSI